MSKRPRDPSQLAKLIADIATGEVQDDISEKKKKPYFPRGQAGGLKGGKARARSLNPNRRKAIARKAARSRWAKKRQ